MSDSAEQKLREGIALMFPNEPTPESFTLTLTKAEAEAITTAWALVAAVFVKSPTGMAAMLVELTANHMPALEVITDKMTKLTDELESGE